MNEAQMDRSQFRRPEVVILLSVGMFLFSWSLAHGVPVWQSLLLTTFTVGLSSFGAVLWESLCIKRLAHPLESFAAGFVLASSVATVLDQVLIGWSSRFEVLRWSYGLLSIIYSIAWTRRAKNSTEPQSANWEIVLPITFAAVSIAQAGANGWAIATVCFLVIAFCLHMRWLRTDNKLNLIVLLALIATSNAMIYIFRPKFTMADWRLFRMFTGSDDQIFSEAASNSLVHLGPFDSIYSLRTHVPYHWFTFAWTGNLGHLIGGDAFTATLHVAVPIGLLFTALLLWVVVTTITEKHFAGLIAIVATFILSSSPMPLRFIYIINTSNIVSHVWLLLSLLLLVRLLSSTIRFGLPLLCFVSALALLAKVPYGVVLYCGLGAALISAPFSISFSAKKTVVALCSLFVTAVVVFKIFLEPQSWQDRGFRVFFNSANLAVGSRFYPLAPIVLISAIALARFPYYLLAQWTFQRKLQPVIFFIIGSTTMSLVRFFIEGSSAENYFFSAGLLFAGVGIGIYWGSIDDKVLNSTKRRLIAVAFISCCASLSVAIASPTDKHSNWLIFLPILLGGCGVVFSLLIDRPENFWSKLSVITTTFAAIMLGSGVGSFLRISLNQPEIELASVVSPSEIDSLTWIRHNTNARDLLASNRNLCGGISNCDQDETRQVIAAFADRQVLIEGPRFLNGARDYPEWAKSRISVVLDFAASPNIKSLEVLRGYGVDWFYLVKTDPRTAPINEFENLSTPIAYQNSEIAVIDLRDN
jgi:hypothetical protein